MPRLSSISQLTVRVLCDRPFEGRWTYYGGWSHNGTHVVDTLRMFFGDDIEIVSARVKHHERAGDPNLVVELDVQGAPVIVDAFEERYYQVFDATVMFESGVVRLRDFGARIEIETRHVNEVGESVLSADCESPIIGLQSPMWHVVEFVDSILTGTALSESMGVDLGSAEKTMGIIWQAQEMAKVRGRCECYR